MSRVALFAHFIVILLQLASCRPLQQATVVKEVPTQLFKDSRRLALAGPGSSGDEDRLWSQFSDVGRKFLWKRSQDLDQPMAERQRRRSLKEIFKDYELESSPPRRTALESSSEIDAASSAPDANTFEETMRTDYAPVRRRPPINNSAPSRVNKEAGN